MISGEGMGKRAKGEAPRDFKHLAIHVLVRMGFLVFSNIAAKDTVDLVVGISKNGELRIAGIRIKTSSFQKVKKRKTSSLQRRKESWGWYFSEDKAQYAVLKPSFFYVFCLEQKKTTEDTLIAEPKFIVISRSDLAKKTTTFRNGNYAVKISENQMNTTSNRSIWRNFVNNFEQIRRTLEDAS